MAKDLRPIYQAVNADVAAAQLEEFAGHSHVSRTLPVVPWSMRRISEYPGVARD